MVKKSRESYTELKTCIYGEDKPDGEVDSVLFDGNFISFRAFYCITSRPYLILRRGRSSPAIPVDFLLMRTS